MAAVADYIAGQVGAAGFTIRRYDVPATRYAIDYAPGRAPMLQRLADGTAVQDRERFLAPGPDRTRWHRMRRADGGHGRARRVRPRSVRRGEPGVEERSGHASDVVAQIERRGGIGAVVQGDVRRDLVIALRFRRRRSPSSCRSSPTATCSASACACGPWARRPPPSCTTSIGVRRPPPGSNR